MMATTPEPGEPEFMSRAAPYSQRRLSEDDGLARLVSLAASTLAMPYGNISGNFRRAFNMRTQGSEMQAQNRADRTAMAMGAVSCSLGWLVWRAG